MGTKTTRELVKHACREATLAKALRVVALHECDRAVRQAEQSTDGTYETCFEGLFHAVLRGWLVRYKHDAASVHVEELAAAHAELARLRDGIEELRDELTEDYQRAPHDADVALGYVLAATHRLELLVYPERVPDPEEGGGT